MHLRWVSERIHNHFWSFCTRVDVAKRMNHILLKEIQEFLQERLFAKSTIKNFYYISSSNLPFSFHCIESLCITFKMIRKWLIIILNYKSCISNIKTSIHYSTIVAKLTYMETIHIFLASCFITLKVNSENFKLNETIYDMRSWEIFSWAVNQFWKRTEVNYWKVNKWMNEFEDR